MRIGQLLTPGQVADLLALPVRTVRQMIRDGQLRARSRYRVPSTAVAGTGLPPTPAGAGAPPGQGEGRAEPPRA